jgi:putative transposase
MRYDTDLNDAQWKLIKRYIPAPEHGGRPRETDEREVVNAIFYFITHGCKWRGLPVDFPPWQTVYRYYLDWRKKLVWKKIQHSLHEQVRQQEGKKKKPTAVVIDSQSVKTGKMAAVSSRGYDGGKRVKGRKRHIVAG